MRRGLLSQGTNVPFRKLHSFKNCKLYVGSALVGITDDHDIFSFGNRMNGGGMQSD